ncbi:hypothetical protein DAEQUDRAFT_729022, partial [Daedalea quercina L-15889]
PDASSTYRYLLNFTYENETSKRAKVSDVAEAVLKEVRDNSPAHKLAGTDFDTLTAQIYVVDTELFPTNASRRQKKAVWNNIDYATINGNTEILSRKKTLSGGMSLLAIVLRPVGVAHRSTALHAVAEGVEAHYYAYRERIAEAGRKRQAPSSGARASELLKTQRSNRPDAVYNYRPLSLTAPQITIYHPVFAKFLAMMAEPLDKIDFTPDELKRSWAFISESSLYHNSEYSRVNAIREAFADAVHKHVTTGTGLTYSSGTVKPDGAVIASQAKVEGFAPISCITEVKNEVGTGNCDPLAQAECVYVATYSSDEAEAFRAICCCPAFLIGMAGPNIIVSGAVFADQIIAQALTSYVYVIPRPALGEYSPLERVMCEVARLFRALKVCIEYLNVYYGELAQNIKGEPKPNLPRKSPRLAGGSLRTTPISSAATLLSSVPPPVFIGPWFSEYRDSAGQEFTLQYVRRLAIDFSSKAVFLAKARCAPKKQEVDVVVKFTEKYGADAHRLAYKHGFAPELRFCDKIDSIGMQVIVMDYVNGDMATASLAAATASSLRKAVEMLHADGFVFGDLREPNVMIAEDGKVKLIDFDWSGRVGEVRYPHDIAMDEGIKKLYGWHPEVHGRGLIAKEHDTHMIERLVQQVNKPK